MKLLLLLCVPLWSLTLFGGMSPLNEEQYFTGTGIITHDEGSAERYLVSLSIVQKSDREVHVNYDMLYSDKSMTSMLKLMFDSPESSFFSVHDRHMNDMRVGHGYCWGDYCHVTWRHMLYQVEYGFYKSGGNIKGMGSKLAENGDLCVWKEKLSPLN